MGTIIIVLDLQVFSHKKGNRIIKAVTEAPPMPVHFRERIFRETSSNSQYGKIGFFVVQGTAAMPSRE
jgi:hypothetical protein